MKKIMRTFISAVKSWTSGKIKESTADWNQNDINANDYVKNRTHYTKNEKIVVLEQVTLDFSVQDNGLFGQVFFYAPGFYLDFDQTYTVVLDEKVYDNVYIPPQGPEEHYPTLGASLNDIYNNNKTKYPFAIQTGEEIFITIKGSSPTHTLKIFHHREIIKQIDNKYLLDKPGLVIPEGKKYNIYPNIYTVGESAETFNLRTDPITGIAVINNIATGHFSHAEGVSTNAIGDSSHAEGGYTKAIGDSSHAEGGYTKAEGAFAHAENYWTKAFGNYSHAEGRETIASSKNQHVQGKYNIEDANNKYAHIVGNGTSSNRSNAHILDWNGNAEFQGDVIVNGCGGSNPISLTEFYTQTHSIPTEIVFKDIESGLNYLIQMKSGNLVSTICTSFIKVTNMPTKTIYMDGDAFDPTGMIVTAITLDGSAKEITNFTYSKYVNNGIVTITYREGNLEFTTNIYVTTEIFDPAVVLADFEYIKNENDTYTLTKWKETLNGISSTEMIIPNNEKIVL